MSGALNRKLGTDPRANLSQGVKWYTVYILIWNIKVPSFCSLKKVLLLQIKRFKYLNICTPRGIQFLYWHSPKQSCNLKSMPSLEGILSMFSDDDIIKVPAMGNTWHQFLTFPNLYTWSFIQLWTLQWQNQKELGSEIQKIGTAGTWMLHTNAAPGSTFFKISASKQHQSQRNVCTADANMQATIQNCLLPSTPQKEWH